MSRVVLEDFPRHVQKRFDPGSRGAWCPPWFEFLFMDVAGCILICLAEHLRVHIG